MEKEIFDELNKTADDFWHDRMILDNNKIQHLRYLRITKFAHVFDEALKNFLKIRRFNVEKNDPNVDKILGINPTRDYFEACDKFLEVVTIAKSNDLFIDKQIIKELDDYKEKYSKFEETLNQKESTIQQQQNIIKTYITQIENALKAFPDIKQYFGISESEVEKG